MNIYDTASVGATDATDCCDPTVSRRTRRRRHDAYRAQSAALAAEPNLFQRVILFALPRTGRHVYAGTVSPDEIAKRRAARKARRATRQAQRRAAA